MTESNMFEQPWIHWPGDGRDPQSRVVHVDGVQVEACCYADTENGIARFFDIDDPRKVLTITGTVRVLDRATGLDHGEVLSLKALRAELAEAKRQIAVLRTQASSCVCQTISIAHQHDKGHQAQLARIAADDVLKPSIRIAADNSLEKVLRS